MPGTSKPTSEPPTKPTNHPPRTPELIKITQQKRSAINHQTGTTSSSLPIIRAFLSTFRLTYIAKATSEILRSTIHQWSVYPELTSQPHVTRAKTGERTDARVGLHNT